MKANNARAKATPDDRASLQFKQEATDAAISSPPADSVSDYTALSTSSSVPAKTNTRKRKASVKVAERAESPARVLRSGKRMKGTSAPASQTRRVKTEKNDAVRLDDDLPRALVPENSLAATSRKPGPMLPSVAPPTRSAKPPAARPEAAAKGRTQPKNMHARIPPVAGGLRAGPVFHSQFQNNGPADFTPSANIVRGRLGPVPYTPQAAGAQMHAHLLPSLAPAFDWGTHAAAQSAPAHVADDPVSASTRKFNVRHATLCNSNPADPYA